MGYVYTLRILIVGLTTVLALTNFNSVDFRNSIIYNKIQI
ncbi:hypothetical protein RC62_3305 [Flavobacterium aquidurense]|uniref:Uncharacterized protein n=1 Tax=Flavobacterium aquidurense TaxID=362413 RepID=A0A0N8VNJ5_9FLAO|nr:hypothetical protein RC62_3305 [Flavobacterium aquidurense]